MFGLLNKRISTSDFTIVAGPGIGNDNTLDKENRPTSQMRGKYQRKVSEKVGPSGPVVTQEAFDQLLNDLQIPSTLRVKLNGMDQNVKAEMLKSSQLPKSITTRVPSTPRVIKKAHSDESLSPQRVQRSQAAGPPFSSNIYALERPAVQHHSRGLSFDQSKPVTMDALDLKQINPKDKNALRTVTPVKFCSILTSTSSTRLDVEIVKKLRLCLRNEPAEWSQEFLSKGGYASLLTRVNEILEVEWREEQHDDQILHELLRCLKALSTSEIGCFALRSSMPTPFAQLMSLLYSDKKPGDVATRQLIVELLLILVDLYAGAAEPKHDGRAARTLTSSIKLPAPHENVYSLIRALLLTPAPPPTESPATPISPHAFIESLHQPRIFKNYLKEVADICRDYFWVFCHPNNTIWVLSQTDEGRVEKPRAPGGMTGGVEYEAMNYLTTHLRLINAIAKEAYALDLPKDHHMSAWRLHYDLFQSGIERIILIARKASTTYYPTLHMELSRYIAQAGESKYEIPWTVSRLMGPPPEGLTKGRKSRVERDSPHRPKVPVLPLPKKIEPIAF